MHVSIPEGRLNDWHNYLEECQAFLAIFGKSAEIVGISVGRCDDTKRRASIEYRLRPLNEEDKLEQEPARLINAAAVGRAVNGHARNGFETMSYAHTRGGKLYTPGPD